MNTPKVKQIDRQSLKHAIRPALNKKLEELSKELGIQITAGNASYDHTGQNGSFKLDMAMISESGEVITQERKDYEQYHSMFGLPADGLGTEIVIHGERLRIAGLRMKARKNNVLLDTCDDSGTQRIAPAALVTNALKQVA